MHTCKTTGHTRCSGEQPSHVSGLSTVALSNLVFTACRNARIASAVLAMAIFSDSEAVEACICRLNVM